jgi:AcrR family transcriptional regulator
VTVRRRAWNGHAPETPAEARRLLLEAARACVERFGPKASLSDVASEAGVTRQTVYRYFENTDDLFRSATALASGGFLERMRASSRVQETFEERVVECLVFTIRELGSDPHLGTFHPSDELLSVGYLLELGFVQEELAAIADESDLYAPNAIQELAELLVRLLHSFLSEPKPERTEGELRGLLQRWLLPWLRELPRVGDATGA